MNNNNKKRASKVVTLVLVSSVLSSCFKNTEENTINKPTQKVYMRADSTAQYTDVTENYNQQQNAHGGGIGTSLLWFMAFRSLTGGMGYTNQGLHQQSNIGTNTAKANAVQKQAIRGGFGKTGQSKTVTS